MDFSTMTDEELKQQVDGVLNIASERHLREILSKIDPKVITTAIRDILVDRGIMPSISDQILAKAKRDEV